MLDTVNGWILLKVNLSFFSFSKPVANYWVQSLIYCQLVLNIFNVTISLVTERHIKFSPVSKKEGKY